jgi:hypothetical protein
MTSNLCVPMGNSEMKVEWALLIAHVCKSSCDVQIKSHVHPCSAQNGANNCVTDGLAMFL